MKTYIVNKILLTGFILLAACSARAADEKDLIAVLRSDASVSAKCAACQQLRIYGSAKSIPDLAALLTEENLAHAARYALEGLPYPEAGVALRGALDKTTGLIKAGVIDSLGWRRDMTSVPLIVPLLSDANITIAATTASALGKIGGGDAVTALIAARDNSNPEVKTAILDALLLCAENHLSAGKEDDAVSLYRDLFQSKVPGPIRIAAWRGWMLSDGKQRRNQIPKVLTGSDTHMQLAAIKIIRELKDRQLIALCLRQWKSLPSPAQLAVLDAHLQFGSEALPTVRTASQSPHPEVRAAAWRALVDLSDASLIPAVVRVAAHAESIEKNAAREALTRMRGPNVRPALLSYLKKAKSLEKAELLRTLGLRGDAAATSILLENAEVGEDIVKLAALDSLRNLAVPETLEPLLKIAAVSKTRSQRTAALKALYAVCRECPDIKLASRHIITAMQSFSATELYNVLPLLAQLATPEALAVVQKATQDSDVQLSRESLRVLTLWPNATPVQFLFDLARTSSNPTVQTVALRGGITVAGREPDPSTRLAMLRKALTYSNRTEEKIMVLSQLSRISTPESLNMAIEHLENPALVNEAGLAAVSIAESLAAGNPKLVDEAARKILENCKLQAVVSRAWALRVKTPASGPFIRDWLVSELYRQPGASGAVAIFNFEFGPENPRNAVKWYAAPVGDTMHLAAYFPGQTDCVAYLKAEIVAPDATDAILLMGSDDGIKAWLNGTVVHSNNIDRGQVVDQDIAPIKLKQGVNELLLKITQGGGGWSACARIVGTDNFPIEGLRFTSQTDKAPPISAYKPVPVSAPVLKEATLPPRDSFRTLRLSDQFYAEGAYYGDFNRDGKPDLVAGPFWFEGPNFQRSHEYRTVKTFDPKNYSDNFLTFTGDFNGDKWIDILCVPFPGSEGYWYANPADKAGHWQRYLAHSSIGNESPVWGDITGDGQAELIFTIDGYLGYAGPDPAKPDQPWAFHAISTKDKRYQKFTHGAGFGDINDDRRKDVVEAVGWWEQPADIKADTPWTFHPFRFADTAAQMLVNDVDGDGLMDIITAWHCHHYGLVWWKQIKKTDGLTDWKQHVILSPSPDVSTTNFRVSQLHALKLIDMNNDGLEDILTGKRFWAHGPTGDKEPDAPAVVFWLELRRNGKGNVTFIPHLIDDDSGVGTQVAASDLNGDNRHDVIVANKKGIFLHLSGPAE